MNKMSHHFMYWLNVVTMLLYGVVIVASQSTTHMSNGDQSQCTDDFLVSQLGGIKTNQNQIATQITLMKSSVDQYDSGINDKLQQGQTSSRVKHDEMTSKLDSLASTLDSTKLQQDAMEGQLAELKENVTNKQSDLTHQLTQLKSSVDTQITELKSSGDTQFAELKSKVDMQLTQIKSSIAQLESKMAAKIDGYQALIQQHVSNCSVSGNEDPSPQPTSQPNATNHPIGSVSTTSGKLQDGTLRLVLANTDATFFGRVEMFYDGQWGTICGYSTNGWEVNAARVACRQLGLPHGNPLPKDGAYYGQGSGDILLDDLDCKGTESTLLDCIHRGVGVHGCYHSWDAGVICQD